MLDTPVDAWYAWIGVALTSLVVLGVATSLPTSPPPDAAAAAQTIDVVAAATYPSTATHPVDATAIKIEPSSISLRENGAIRSAGLRYGPVTPANTRRLRRVASGTPPGTVYESPSAFARATSTSRNTSAEWSAIDGVLRVRKVTWEGHDVTLVTA